MAFILQTFSITVTHSVGVNGTPTSVYPLLVNSFTEMEETKVGTLICLHTHLILKTNLRDKQGRYYCSHVKDEKMGVSEKSNDLLRVTRLINGRAGVECKALIQSLLFHIR